MALNINYQGGVFDESGNQIDCYFQAFSTNIGKWSDLRQTEYGQYNVNFGDGDLNTQSGSVSVGDVLMVAFWTGDQSRNNQLQLFSVVAFVYNGVDSTVQDIELRAPISPACSFSYSSTGTVDVTTSVSSRASTTYQWTYSGATLYQRNNWYGQTVFGFLDIATDEFDFGDGYSATTSHSYSTSGVFTIHHYVESTYGLSSTCQSDINIYYPSPSSDIVFSPSSPILGESISIENTTEDVYGRVTSIEYYFDGAFIYDGQELIYNYDKVLDVFGTHNAQVKVFWNDGFYDKTYTRTEYVSMENQPPTVTLTTSEDANSPGKFIATAVAEDIDGTISDICWELYYEGESSGLPHPYFKCEEATTPEYKRIYSICDVSLTTLGAIFAIPGNYKYIVTVKDNMGATATDVNEFAVTTVCDGVLGECPPCPDCPDCPDCPEYVPEDCTDRINIAVRELKIKLLEEMEKNNKTIVVQDSRVSGSVDSIMSSGMSGEVDGGDLAGELSGNMGGKVATSRTKGSIGGKIDGEVKGG